MSLDVAKLNGMLSHLAQQLGLLERLREEVTVAQLRDDLRLQAMVKYPLLIAIQICIDMANHIVAASRLPKAETYAQIFGRLAEAGMISQELARALALAVGLRNRLVHGYTEIEVEELYRVLQEDIEDLGRFAQAVVALLRGEK